MSLGEEESRRPAPEPQIFSPSSAPMQEIRKPLFSPKPAPVIKTIKDEPEEDEVELDIPAFIRKKMK